MRKKRLLWFAAAVLMLALFSVTAYAAEGDADKITVEPITNDPYPIAMGLHEKISNLFTFANVPDGYALSAVQVDADAATMFQIDDFGTPDFYLICKSSAETPPTSLSLTFVFTSAEHPAEPKEAEGTISIELNGNPFYGANAPGQTQTIHSDQDAFNIVLFPKKDFEAQDVNVFLSYQKVLMDTWFAHNIVLSYVFHVVLKLVILKSELRWKATYRYPARSVSGKEVVLMLIKPLMVKHVGRTVSVPFTCIQRV